MKKLLAILVVAILATTFAMSQHNAPVNATAQFDVKVIKALTITVDNGGSITLPDIIQGQSRTWGAKTLTFTIDGEASYSIDATVTGPTPDDVNNPAGPLALTQTVSAVPTSLDAAGQAFVTWSCTGADASLAGTGTYKFSLNVDAKYTGL
ncbi:hypothetical protein MASR1M45_17410 [Candidatus Kapaibacterium sp.]